MRQRPTGMRSDKSGQAIRPVQARGVLRFERLLDTAADLVSLYGAYGFPLIAVAKASETAQGSLYQFFPSKDALLAALYARYEGGITQISSEIRNHLSATGATVDAMVDQYLDRLLCFYLENPAYRRLRLDLAAAAGQNDAEARIDRAVVGDIAALLHQMRPGSTRADCEFTARIALEIGDCLLTAAANEQGAKTRTRIVRHAAHLLSKYLADPAP